MDWLRRLRVAEARRLLADLDLPVKEVGRRVGFEDPYHFSRVFRAIDGLSPSAHREAILTSARPAGDPST
jgi:transcriptional regulator GlxA family with amidase domain